MKHVSIKDFLPESGGSSNGKQKVDVLEQRVKEFEAKSKALKANNDTVTDTTNAKGEAKSLQSPRDNGADSKQSIDGSTGADTVQKDTDAEPDGSSDVSIETTPKSGDKRNGRTPSKTSTKKGK